MILYIHIMSNEITINQTSIEIKSR